ncbi:MAG: oxalate/formate MFS antiporter, partial [Burkholderiaceae bacterium]
MSQATLNAQRPLPATSDKTRWIQLLVGVVCMIATANIQYAWTLFVPEIQIAFTLFVLVQTWLAPIEGHFIDKFGPRVMVAFGAVMIGCAWIINSQATSLLGFYVGAA